MVFFYPIQLGLNVTIFFTNLIRLWGDGEGDGASRGGQEGLVAVGGERGRVGEPGRGCLG